MKSSLLILAASLTCAVAAHADVYNSEAGTANNTPNSLSPGTQYTHYLESVTLAGAAPVTLTDLEVSVHFNNYNADQDIYALIYSGGNLASTTDITGTFLGYGATIAGVPLLASRTATNDYFYSFSLVPDSAGSLTIAPGTQIEVEFRLTLDNATNQFAASNAIVGNFSAGGVATTGTNVGGSVYASAAPDTSTPLTASNVIPGQSIRFALNPVPEPSALVFSALAGCLLLGSALRMRKARVAA